MLMCSESLQIDAPKRTDTVNAFSGYDQVLIPFKPWQILFGLVASAIYPAATLQYQLLFLIQAEAMVRSDYQP